MRLLHQEIPEAALDAPHTPTRREKQWRAIGVIALVVTLAAPNVISIAVLALTGAVLVLVTRCLDVEEACESVEWKIIFLIFGMLALGVSLSHQWGLCGF